MAILISGPPSVLTTGKPDWPRTALLRQTVKNTAGRFFIGARASTRTVRKINLTQKDER